MMFVTQWKPLWTDPDRASSFTAEAFPTVLSFSPQSEQAGGPDYRVRFIPEGGPSKLRLGGVFLSANPNLGKIPQPFHFPLELSPSLAIT